MAFAAINTLKPIIKNYSWGNNSFISSLLNKKGGEVEAELWMGAHPLGSSFLENGITLYDQLNEDISIAGFDGKSFPYLFKILAIDSILSIQCHPNRKQSKEGYKKEEEKRQKGVLSNLNYKDPNPKEEMFLALTPSTALLGFKTLDSIKEAFKTYASQSFFKYFSEIGTIKLFFHTLYNLSLEERLDIQKEFLSNLGYESDENQVFITPKALFNSLCNKYPGDPGVFAPYFMNLVYLNPGEAINIKPGLLHAYVKGNGAELMDNSDNVLRGGLTQKYMDVNELEKIMNFECSCPKLMNIVTDKRGKNYICSSFILTLMDKGSYESSSSTRIYLCLEGNGTLSAKNETVTIKKGQCFFVPYSSGLCSATVNNGVLLMASNN